MSKIFLHFKLSPKLCQPSFEWNIDCDSIIPYLNYYQQHDLMPSCTNWPLKLNLYATVYPTKSRILAVPTSFDLASKNDVLLFVSDIEMFYWIKLLWNYLLHKGLFVLFCLNRSENQVVKCFKMKANSDYRLCK